MKFEAVSRDASNKLASWRVGKLAGGKRLALFTCLLCIHAFLFLTGCQPQNAYAESVASEQSSVFSDKLDGEDDSPLSTATPFPTRPAYRPAELVDYVAQIGDTLPALAIRFNTTVEEILAANEFIPPDATTMPPGMPMKIPIQLIHFFLYDVNFITRSLRILHILSEIPHKITKGFPHPNKCFDESFKSRNHAII